MQQNQILKVVFTLCIELTLRLTVYNSSGDDSFFEQGVFKKANMPPEVLLEQHHHGPGYLTKVTHCTMPLAVTISENHRE